MNSTANRTAAESAEVRSERAACQKICTDQARLLREMADSLEGTTDPVLLASAVEKRRTADLLDNVALAMARPDRDLGELEREQFSRAVESIGRRAARPRSSTTRPPGTRTKTTRTRHTTGQPRRTDYTLKAHEVERGDRLPTEVHRFATDLRAWRDRSSQSNLLVDAHPMTEAGPGNGAEQAQETEPRERSSTPPRDRQHQHGQREHGRDGRPGQ